MKGVNFVNFTIHLTIGAILAMIQTYIQIQFKFWTISDLRVNEPHDIVELREKIDIWKRAAASIITLTEDENVIRDILSKKIDLLQEQLEEKVSIGLISAEIYEQTLQDLEKKVLILPYVFLTN